MPESPFERLGLDIDASLAELTRTLRERIEDAEDEDERARLRALWEQLTGRFEERAALALSALPLREPTLAPWPPAAPVPSAEADHPLDRQPLPPLPLEWDTLTERELPAAGAIDLETDPALCALAEVVLP